MMQKITEKIPRKELQLRHDRCLKLLEKHVPEASGLLAFSRVAIYHLTGTLNEGVFWLPHNGTPLLLLRRGVERARLESPLTEIHPFKSFGQLQSLLGMENDALGDMIGVELSGLSWTHGEMFKERVPNIKISNADIVLLQSRSVKTSWELKKMRLAGARHHHCLYHVLPEVLASGNSEREIAHAAWNVFFKYGHSGPLRMSNSEIFLGHVAVGENANYPSHFNGPVGLVGEHPATPFMGYHGSVLNDDSLLTCDIGFSLEGYQTDKTQVYWSGARHTIPSKILDAHQFCIDVQQELASRLKPGVAPAELYDHCVAMARKAGKTEGFMALNSNHVGFVGHGIGLHIDEWPVIAPKFESPLEVGMTIALEPKIGLPGLGMVGVENTFEVTSEGGVCLTGDSFDIVTLQ